MARHFTVDEANALLPILTPVIQGIQTLHRQMMELVQDIAEFETRAAGNGHGEGTDVISPNRSLHKVRREIEQRLSYLQGVGVQLKDADEGVVDFPSRMFDREVYLCWRLGEPSVAHWHDTESGFGGRQPL